MASNQASTSTLITSTTTPNVPSSTANEASTSITQSTTNTGPSITTSNLISSSSSTTTQPSGSFRTITETGYIGDNLSTYVYTVTVYPSCSSYISISTTIISASYVTTGGVYSTGIVVNDKCIYLPAAATSTSGSGGTLHRAGDMQLTSKQINGITWGALAFVILAVVAVWWVLRRPYYKKKAARGDGAKVGGSVVSGGDREHVVAKVVELGVRKV